MKQQLFCGIALFSAFATHSTFAAPAYTHANTISAHNIGVIQHSITQSAISSFMAAPGYIIGQHAKQALPDTHTPLYGTAPMYGEYNDDGNTGRNGGDIYNADATLNNIWVKWNHLDSDAKFDDFAKLNTDIDTFMFGISGGQTEFAGGISKWGLYSGYITSDQENHDIKINENGGFFGLYNGNTFGDLGIYATVNGGVLSNSADTLFGTDEYTNFWIGGAINTTYNIALDNTFTIQPALHLGYTWIRSENYTATSGDIINNDAFGMLEVSPTIRAIKHIGNGWFGALNAQYVMLFTNGGDTTVNNVGITELESNNFFEYSISLEKAVSNFVMSGHIGRHDGARTGWIGGINIKYVF